MSRGTILLPDERATLALGASLAAVLRAGDVAALSGPLGAGKTTFARGLLGGLGLIGEAPSPSFALVIEYAPPDVRLPLGHVDLYRLNAPEEVDELGLDDMLADGALVVEWPERGGPARWPLALALAFADAEDAARARRLTWEAPAAWEGRWPPAYP